MEVEWGHLSGQSKNMCCCEPPTNGGHQADNEQTELKSQMCCWLASLPVGKLCWRIEQMPSATMWSDTQDFGPTLKAAASAEHLQHQHVASRTQGTTSGKAAAARAAANCSSARLQQHVWM